MARVRYVKTLEQLKKAAEANPEFLSSTVRSLRMGIPYLELRGSVRESLPAREFTEYGYCYKALPSCEKSGGFDGDRLLVRLEYEEGTSQSNGRVLRSVPGEWLLPFLHQRYDDPGAPGVEIPV